MDVDPVVGEDRRPPDDDRHRDEVAVPQRPGVIPDLGGGGRVEGEDQLLERHAGEEVRARVLVLPAGVAGDDGPDRGPLVTDPDDVALEADLLPAFA